MDAYLNTWSAEDLGIKAEVQRADFTTTLLDYFNGKKDLPATLEPFNLPDTAKTDVIANTLEEYKQEWDSAKQSLENGSSTPNVFTAERDTILDYCLEDLSNFLGKDITEKEIVKEPIVVGDKALTTPQEKELMQGKEVTVNDVSYNGKNCNAKVFVKDGEIKKQFTPATLKQGQKPTATTKRKQPQKRSGVKM